MGNSTSTYTRLNTTEPDQENESSSWVTLTNYKTEIYKKFIQESDRNIQMDIINDNMSVLSEELVMLLEREWKTPTNDQKVLLAHIYYKLAHNTNRLNYMNNSLELCTPVISETEETPESELVWFRVYNVLGNIYKTSKWSKYDEGKSIEYYKKGIQCGDITCCLNLGDLYIDKGMEKQALNLLVKGSKSDGRLGKYCYERIGHFSEKQIQQYKLSIGCNCN